MSARFRVQLAYDGTDFHGSQSQTEFRTVQGDVEKSLKKIGWQGKSVIFAGRTDAGVHAAGQVIGFDFDWNHTKEELHKAFNAVLPQDISAIRIDQTKDDFHPRYDALSREYHYMILSSSIRNPLLERFHWRVWPEIDIKLMQRASRCLRGVHDFAALGNPHKPGGSTERKIFRTSWKKQGDILRFEIVGNAFLYHMVRRIVQVLINIGQNKETFTKLEEYLSNPSGPPSQGLAPAKGLSLDRVRYE